MSITWKLRNWAEDNRTRLYMGGLYPYEVGAIADEIEAEHKRLTDKAHADGEKSAMKQMRSKSEDYKKGYEQAMADVERTMEERTKTEQNGAGITDELRACINMANRSYEDTRNPYNDREILHIPEEELTAIADRIDAEHEAACAEAYGNGVMSVPIALDESQWVKLPVSEDGDVLHIGEVVDEKLPFGGYAAPAPIDTMELSRGASGYVWMVKLDAENRALINPNLLRHHHAPTVEDVLRELIHRYDELRRGSNAFDPFELTAEYAAKLRLAGDAK